MFPAEVIIENGIVPSAILEGAYATIDLAKAGCDCESSVVTGKLKYSDGKGPDLVQFNGTIEHTLNKGCEIPADTNLWAAGVYNPGQGLFKIGLFPNTHESFDWVKCANCSNDDQLCWRLWLEGGKYDGYRNWACELENMDALTVVEHPPGSPCE